MTGTKERVTTNEGLVQCVTLRRQASYLMVKCLKISITFCVMCAMMRMSENRIMPPSYSNHLNFLFVLYVTGMDQSKNLLSFYANYITTEVSSGYIVIFLNKFQIDTSHVWIPACAHYSPIYRYCPRQLQSH